MFCFPAAFFAFLLRASAILAAAQIFHPATLKNTAIATALIPRIFRAFIPVFRSKASCTPSTPLRLAYSLFQPNSIGTHGLGRPQKPWIERRE